MKFITLSLALLLSQLSDAVPPQPTVRRPVALALLAGGDRLCVANERSGSITLVDVTESPKIIREVPVGRSIVDIAAVAARRELLALDGATHELIRLSLVGDRLVERERQPVDPYPVNLQVTADGALCAVAALWSRSVMIIDLSGDAPPKSIALPFSPREQLFVNAGSRLVVADSFGGKLAVIDVGKRELECVREFPAHNIRGLARTRDGRQLIVSHQILSRNARTQFDDVHWGSLMTNNLRVVSIEALLDPSRDLVAESRLHFLGDVGNAAGDPASVAVSAQGKVGIALAGVSQVALGGENELRFERQPVGRRPTAALFSAAGDRLYVANTLGDSVSIITLGENASHTELALGKTVELTPAERGEQLFYDARLSHDGWLSCHSCHTDGHSNGLFADTLGDGSFGDAKRVLSLLGVGETGPWAWNGTVEKLEDQVRKSIETTMHGEAPSAQQVADLNAFLMTLEPAPQPAPSKADSIAEGRGVFVDFGCDSCHVPPTYTSRRAYDVGLSDRVGNTKFNPPSLRGCGQRSSLFHDGRAVNLESVLVDHDHQLDRELSSQELALLVEFLRSL